MRPSNSVEWLVATLCIHVLPASNFGPEAAVLTDGGFVLSSSVAIGKGKDSSSKQATSSYFASFLIHV